MTAVLILGSDVPLMQRLFPPMSLVEQVQHTPFLVFGAMQDDDITVLTVSRVAVETGG
jgi:hypothetical protein